MHAGLVNLFLYLGSGNPVDLLVPLLNARSGIEDLQGQKVSSLK
jgi:hypothetical protein